MSEKPVTRRNYIKYGAGAIVAVGVVGAAGYYSTRITTVPPGETTSYTPKNPFKIAGILVWVRNDNGFYQVQVEKAIEYVTEADALAREHGWDGIQYDYTENVSIPDAERVIRDYCDKGYNFVQHTWGGRDEEVLKRVAVDYPDIDFSSTCSWVPLANNVAWLCVQSHEAGFLAGILAAGMTKTGKTGVMTAFEIPCVGRACRGYQMGVKHYNEYHGTEVTAPVVITGIFEDIQKNYLAGSAMVDQGMDVIYADGGGPDLAIFQVAKERNIIAIGHVMDQWQLAPDHIMTCVLWNLPAGEMFNDSIRGAFKPARGYFPSMAEGGTGLSPYHNFENKIPADLKDEVEARKQDILTGRLIIPRLDFPVDQLPLVLRPGG